MLGSCKTLKQVVDHIEEWGGVYKIGYCEANGTFIKV